MQSRVVTVKKVTLHGEDMEGEEVGGDIGFVAAVAPPRLSPISLLNNGSNAIVASRPSLRGSLGGCRVYVHSIQQSLRYYNVDLYPSALPVSHNLMPWNHPLPHLIPLHCVKWR